VLIDNCKYRNTKIYQVVLLGYSDQERLVSQVLDIKISIVIVINACEVLDGIPKVTDRPRSRRK